MIARPEVTGGKKAVEMAANKPTAAKQAKEEQCFTTLSSF